MKKNRAEVSSSSLEARKYLVMNEKLKETWGKRVEMKTTREDKEFQNLNEMKIENEDST